MGAVSVALATVSLAERALGVCATVRPADRGRRRLWPRRAPLCQSPALASVGSQPDPGRGAAVAEAFGGEAVPFDAIASILPSVDVVVSATRAPGTWSRVTWCGARWSHWPDRPLVLVDIAVPRDIDPAAAADRARVPVQSMPSTPWSTGVWRTGSARCPASRRSMNECRKLMAWTRGHGAAVCRARARGTLRAGAREEVRRNLKHFHAEEEAYIDRMTRTLINRLLRSPITRLTSGDGSPSVESARQDLLRDL